MKNKRIFNFFIYSNFKKLILFIIFTVILSERTRGVEFDRNIVQKDQRYVSKRCGDTTCADKNNNYYTEDYLLDYDSNSAFIEDNVSQKREKINSFIKAHLDDLEYKKPGSTHGKGIYPNKYFSFRGAETHSISDVDLDGLLNIDDYYKNRRITRGYKITTKEYEQLVPRKYRYAIGATKRDKYYDTKKEYEKKLVLIITPKNFFADKNGKLVLLPSLALKIMSNSKVLTLVEKIRKIMNKAYPSFRIEKIRHLKTKLILDETVSEFKLSDLKIKNGDEFSVTFKDMPEFSEDGQIPSIEIQDEKIKYENELFDIDDELPLTPIGPVDFEDDKAPIQLSEYATPIENITDNNELLIDNSTIVYRGILDEKVTYPLDKSYRVKNDNYIDNNIKLDLFEDLDRNSKYDDKLTFNNNIELYTDEIDLEKAIEPEKIESNEEIMKLVPENDKFNCSYEIQFRVNKNGSEIGLSLDKLDEIVSESNNDTMNFNLDNSTLLEKIEIIELDDCLVGILLDEIENKVIKTNKNYSLIGLKDYSKNINLFDYMKTPEKSLFEIGINPSDKIVALMDKKQSGKKSNDYYVSITELDSIRSKNKVPDELIPNKNTTTLLIYVETHTKKPDKTKHYNVKRNITLEDGTSINLVSSGTERRKIASRTLKPFSVSAFKYTPINFLIKELKYNMDMIKFNNEIFICGEKIINTKAEIPISTLSGICVLRFNI
ncbi:hypothetical protein FG386_001580 [Cryptosporidium ryanae]|uniref:uncharacterized protein n=1 Tax=Cryptosporidium ryanae TaxID=515981 RepID=UPI00351A4C8B|nr:hypothetical protein FG386_001580 [Cryptosporidium ryanae]